MGMTKEQIAYERGRACGLREGAHIAYNYVRTCRSAAARVLPIDAAMWERAAVVLTDVLNDCRKRASGVDIPQPKKKAKVSRGR